MTALAKLVIYLKSVGQELNGEFNCSQFYKYDISDGRHSIAPCEGDVAAPGPGPGAGEHEPRVNNLPVTLDVVWGNTRNLLVVEVVVDVETENYYIWEVSL